ncbi:TPA: glucosyltransferase domain-containing protein [Proteus mirabilis]|nr:glucosyltransferase domain-containing protein [Proteus mirabilis]MBI6455781.1 glucosyltransferase domain-containing protein [Proteus mirabilis]HEK0981985.1 glucosyltransferase domain-containing protein [Proteus mirabilis]HEK1847052.1 glucosyltransferase domain-containing protein [Proteus mirabilis]
MKHLKLYHLIALIYILPILLGNYNYIDDLNRMHLGYGWDGDGRFAATWAMQFLSGGFYITDIYPYSLIISSLILVYSASIVSEMLDIPKNIRVFTNLFFLVSPYTIESLSYRFDSIPMSLSVLLATIPFLYIEKRTTFFFVSLISLNLCLLTYQSNFFIYPIILICYLFNSILTNKSVCRNDVRITLYSIIAFLISYILYKVEISTFSANLNGRDETIMNGDFLFNAKINIERTYVFLISPLLTLSFLAYFAPTVVISIVSLHKLLYCKIKPLKSLAIFIILMLLIFISVLIASTPNIILLKPWFSVRTAVPFGCLLFFFAIITKLENKNILYACYSIAFVYLFSMMAAFADGFKYQENMRKNITAYFGGEILKHPEAKLVINGVMPNSNVFNSVTSKFPLLKRVIPNYMDNNWNWGVGYFRVNDIVSGKAYPSNALRKKMISNICLSDSVIENEQATLRYSSFDNAFLLDFKKTKC